MNKIIEELKGNPIFILAYAIVAICIICEVYRSHHVSKYHSGQVVENSILKDKLEDASNIMEVEASAYANTEECCYPYFDGKTSIGRDANLWGVAVDPKVIPYGSIIEVEGIGLLKADDCGSAIKGRKIDIRFPDGDIDSARKWGRKRILIKIYKSN